MSKGNKKTKKKVVKNAKVKAKPFVLIDWQEKDIQYFDNVNHVVGAIEEGIDSFYNNDVMVTSEDVPDKNLVEKAITREFAVLHNGFPVDIEVMDIKPSIETKVKLLDMGTEKPVVIKGQQNVIAAREH